MRPGSPDRYALQGEDARSGEGEGEGEDDTKGGPAHFVEATRQDTATAAIEPYASVRAPKQQAAQRASAPPRPPACPLGTTENSEAAGARSASSAAQEPPVQLEQASSNAEGLAGLAGVADDGVHVVDVVDRVDVVHGVDGVDVVVAREEGLAGGFVLVDQGLVLVDQGAKEGHVATEHGARDPGVATTEHGARDPGVATLPLEQMEHPEHSAYVCVGDEQGGSGGAHAHASGPEDREAAGSDDLVRHTRPFDSTQTLPPPSSTAAAGDAGPGMRGSAGVQPSSTLDTTVGLKRNKQESAGAGGRDVSPMSGGRDVSPMSSISWQRAAVKQTAEAARRIQGLRAVLKKMTQRELLRAFNVFVSTVTQMRENRIKVRPSPFPLPQGQ